MTKQKRSMLMFAALLLLMLCQPAQAFDGPLQVGNFFPLFMHSYSPRFESAVPEQSLSASFSYTSVYLTSRSASWDVNIDMELAELKIGYKHTFGKSWELAAEVPVLNLNRGFMDGFLEDFHRTFGLPSYGRNLRPRNEFLYEVKRNGILVLRGRDAGPALGDIRLSAKKMLLEEDPAVSIAAGIDLPTGDAHKGYGSGSVDAGLTVLVNKKLGEKVMSYANMGVIFPGDIRAEQTIELRHSFFGGLGIEAMVTQHLGLLLQATVQTSPFPKTGIRNIDRSGILLAYGVRYTKDNDNFEVSMTEDPNISGAPDFTLNLSYKRRF